MLFTSIIELALGHCLLSPFKNSSFEKVKGIMSNRIERKTKTTDRCNTEQYANCHEQARLETGFALYYSSKIYFKLCRQVCGKLLAAGGSQISLHYLPRSLLKGKMFSRDFELVLSLIVLSIVNY